MLWLTLREADALGQSVCLLALCWEHILALKHLLHNSFLTVLWILAPSIWRYDLDDTMRLRNITDTLDICQGILEFF